MQNIPFLFKPLNHFYLMNNILSEDTKGNLNYLIIEHLKQELSNLDSFEIDSLINKVI